MEGKREEGNALRESERESRSNWEREREREGKKRLNLMVGNVDKA